MREMSSVKKSTICALCIALCYVLPMAFHAVNLGAVFSPMHLPVFICGLICGGGYGLFCGIVGPIISCLLTGMPTVAGLPTMAVELGIYGLMSGLLMKTIRTKRLVPDLYISILISVLLGRIAAGLVGLAMTKLFAGEAAFAITGKGGYFMGWLSAYFLTSWPGTVILLLFVPTIFVALMKAHLIPERYPKEAKT